MIDEISVIYFSPFSCLFHFHFLPLFIFSLSLSLSLHVIIFLLLPSTPPMLELGFDTRVFQEQFPLKQQLKALLQLDILVYIIYIHYVTGKYGYFNEYLRIPLLSSLCPTTSSFAPPHAGVPPPPCLHPFSHYHIVALPPPLPRQSRMHRSCPHQRAPGAKLTMVVLGPLEQEGSI